MNSLPVKLPQCSGSKAFISSGTEILIAILIFPLNSRAFRGTPALKKSDKSIISRSYAQFPTLSVLKRSRSDREPENASKSLKTNHLSRPFSTVHEKLQKNTTHMCHSEIELVMTCVASVQRCITQTEGNQGIFCNRPI